ncbi:hypothetical protein COV22_01855, partial [Candidatus Woesearchaeota archaeon CG10_big_fil_rev_8_21_14_0_10_47_5]
MIHKADLHVHTAGDPQDDFISYTPEELILHAKSLGFSIISITKHDALTRSAALSEFARKLGILLIPGIEIKLERKEVLLYNVTEEDVARLKRISDLERVKRKDVLIVAPHPFFIKRQCLKGKLLRYRHLFDAVEFSRFYCKHVNLNNAAVRFSRRNNLPLVGNSDAHSLEHMNYTYTLLDIDKKRPCVQDVFDAIRDKRVKVATRPLSTSQFI